MAPIIDNYTVMKKNSHLKRNSIDKQQQKLKLKKISMSKIIFQADDPISLRLPEANLPCDQSRRSNIETKYQTSMLDIIIRTINLLEKNYRLQKRVDALRKDFVHLIVNNSNNDNQNNNSNDQVSTDNYKY